MLPCNGHLFPVTTTATTTPTPHSPFSHLRPTSTPILTPTPSFHFYILSLSIGYISPAIAKHILTHAHTNTRMNLNPILTLLPSFHRFIVSCTGHLPTVNTTPPTLRSCPCLHLRPRSPCPQLLLSFKVIEYFVTLHCSPVPSYRNPMATPMAIPTPTPKSTPMISPIISFRIMIYPVTLHWTPFPLYRHAPRQHPRQHLRPR